MMNSVWNIDDLPTVRGRDWRLPGRMTGRTTFMIQDALHQIDFMEEGDEVWLVFPTWAIAKRMCEWVANGLAKELGFAVDKPYETPVSMVDKAIMRRWAGEPNRVRYYLTIEGFPYHFVAFESLELQLRGMRFTHWPCVYFDHTCYEELIDPLDGELYHLLRDASCSLPVSTIL